MFRRKKMNRKTILLGSTVILACAGLGGYLYFRQINQQQAMKMVDKTIDSLTDQENVKNSKKKSHEIKKEKNSNKRKKKNIR